MLIAFVPERHGHTDPGAIPNTRVREWGGGQSWRSSGGAADVKLSEQA
jgi:hypothetical protein